MEDHNWRLRDSSIKRYTSRRNHKSSLILDFYHLKQLSSQSCNDVLANVTKNEAEFQKLISGDMEPDVLVLTINILTKICQSDFVEIITRILSLVCSDKFLTTLDNYLMKLFYKSSTEKFRNAADNGDKNRFWSDLNDLFKKIVELIPHTACNKLIPVVQNMINVTKNIEIYQNYKIDEKIKNTSLKILNDLEENVKSIEAAQKVRAASRSKKEIIEVKEEPPENFRLLNIVPTLADLHNKNPFFRACKVQDAYESIEHYLDVQFRLLREDFLIPLRNGFKEYLTENRYRNSDLRVYKNVQLMALEGNQNTIGNKLFFGKLQNVDWSSSKRFMFGSLLLLSRDNFKTILFATVTDRKRMNLINGHILIEPCQGSEITPNLYKSDFVVLESRIFFMPYFQVLSAMKNINDHNFPMESYLVNAEVSTRLPAYLMHQPVLTFKGTHRLPVGRNALWPTAKQLEMDESQFDAFKSAITQEFAIIQGPPGTGKTFLASQVVRVLLENEDNWRTHGPIIVVCLTNHALDQFLENILQYTNSIVRVGNMSKSKVLCNYTLMKRRDALCMNSRHIGKHLTTPDIIVPLSCLFDDVSSTYFRCDEDLIEWLTDLYLPESSVESLQENLSNLEIDDILGISDDNFDNDNHMYTDDDIQFNHANINRHHYVNSINVLKFIRDEISFVKERIEQLSSFDGHNFHVLNELYMLQYDLSAWMDIDLQLREELKNHPLIMNETREPSDNKRWEEYWSWVKCSYERVSNKINELEGECRRKKLELDETKQIANLEILKKHQIIGLTTTCAARIQSSLRALGAPIVLVEEAAEILESHVVCSITKDCQHVILIGDHKQLRPKASVYELGIKYNLNVSLFERMVNIRGNCLQLAYQHRMRPEISKLITPSIYKTLYNHEVVRDYPNVIGLQKNVFFINHENHEKTYKNEDSYKNDHEVAFLLAFARHLLMQGYEPSEITILCTYSGQLFTFKNEARQHKLLKDVYITTVDNYQGEENKIILLSLVRNNGRGNIGFLKEENRICVALSRAKEGLYIMGNMEDLVVKNNIWPQIRDVLEEDNAIGDTLNLRCHIHPNITIKIKTVEDFIQCPEGGCSKKCDTPLECGHFCTKICHTLDREHAIYQCKENCTKSCPKGHPCPSQCWKVCGPCEVKIKSELQCGHVVDVPCFIDPDKFRCPVLVDATMPECKHDIKIKCHEKIEDCKCTQECQFILPCGHKCAEPCHINTDPDHILYKCIKTCTKYNINCQKNHRCQKLCYESCEPCSILVKKSRSCGHLYHKIECSINIEKIRCDKPCKRILPCKHECQAKCSEECKNCFEKVEKKSSCGHTVTVKCNEEATPINCNNKCTKLLSCGHPCTEKCKDPCTTACKVLGELKEPGLCGHIFSIPCYLKNKDAESQILLKYCQEPCTILLTCGHRCKGNCGNCLQGRMHVLCNEPCQTQFICGHKCEMPCNQECGLCNKKCEFKCQHRMCKRKCGETCTPCKKSCKYGCQHQRCTKRCGELCDIEPCNKICQNKLKCGHPCVGFCGEPCPPLCRICNKDESFGDEDDEDARYILLTDCKHSIESKRLLKWIADSSTFDKSVRVKCCPECKTPINSCMRVMNQVKNYLADLVTIKKSNLLQSEKDLKIQRKKYYNIANIIVNDPIVKRCSQLKFIIQHLQRRKIAVNRTNQISGFAILIEIISILKTLQKPYNDYVFKIIKKQIELLANSMSVTLQISKQRFEDIQLELKRLHLMVKLRMLINEKKISSNKKLDDLVIEICGIKRFFKTMEERLIKSLDELSELNESNID